MPRARGGTTAEMLTVGDGHSSELMAASWRIRWAAHPAPTVATGLKACAWAWPK
jgi:hypothetical protein